MYLANYHEQEYQELVNFIKKFSIFSNFDKRLDNMLMLFEVKSYVRGDIIYKEGDKANCIYLIKKGEV